MLLSRRNPAAPSPAVSRKIHGGRVHAPVRKLIVLAHGHGAAPHATTTSKPREKQEKEKGFINEMRKVAMKLHSKDQAPKEGGKEAPKNQGQWAPTLPGYVRFLTESKAVYEALESAVRDVDHPEYTAFQSTGLERSQALAADLEWFKQTHGLNPPQLKEDGPGMSYSRKVLALAHSDPPAFICHYYNFYFAHTAGGRMIGNKLSGMLLEGHTLNFYKWEGDVSTHLDEVRRKINALAEGWGADQKKHCLEETEDSFKMSGAILQCITQAE